VCGDAGVAGDGGRDGRGFRWRHHLLRTPGAIGADAAYGSRSGTWTAAFSSVERLKRHTGECLWLSTTGADLREQIRPSIGILVDIDDEHTVAIPFASTADLSGGNDE